MNSPAPPLPQLERLTGWEPILPDYSNVRGLNFLPVFTDLFEDPPDLPPHLEFKGTASPVAMWRFWDADAADRQLGYLKRIGINTIRMWTSHPVWEHEERHRGRGENGFIEDWVGFLGLCEKHRIRVMPVLWDELIFDQSAVPYDDIAVWTRSPSVANTNVAWATDPANPFNGDAFVRAVVEASRHSPALFMWDIMNEPLGRPDFHRHYCDRIREWDPDPAHPITIGFAAQVEWETRQLWDHPTHDVLSFHPYGMFRQNVQEWTRMARKVSQPPFADRRKPIIVTEGGAPGEFAPHGKHIDYCRDLGLGFMPWLAIIGDPRGSMPFKEDNGVFHPDGEVRSRDEAMAFQQRAVEQGFVPGLLPHLIEKTDLTGFTPPGVRSGFDVEDLLLDLHPLRWPHRPALTNANVGTDGYGFQRRQLLTLHKDMDWLADVQTPAGILRRGWLTPEDQAELAAFRAEFARRDLFGGPEPWLLGSPPTAIDWPRYEALFTEWGIAFWRIATRNGLGG